MTRAADENARPDVLGSGVIPANPAFRRYPALLMRLLPSIFLVAACSDFNLQGKKPDPGHDPDDTGPFGHDTGVDNSCVAGDFPPAAVAPTDACDYDIGGFEPVVEWEVAGTHVASLPAVADLDGDGMPEIIVNEMPSALPLNPGELAAYHGDGSGKLWSTSGAKTGFGSHPAVADIDDDGVPEIFIVREYQSSLFGAGEYSVIRVSWAGDVVGESEHFIDAEFDYATGIAISDMDHDGSPEIVAGRVILNEDLTTRGVGRDGRGCDALVGFGFIYGEGSNPAVADMDLDGVEEVVVGNAYYDPDGKTIMAVHSGGKDGAVAIGNFDADPEGEFVRVTYNQIEAYDTDGSSMWGPINFPEPVNILASPGVADVDNDGRAEIVTAGGDTLWVLNAEDGSELWRASVVDQSGATGASFFDFDGDGVLEVVYVDEIQIYAFNGPDGVVKFRTDKHGSDTMYDYPVIADVDNDGHAEIVVAHDGFYPAGFSVYGDETNSWTPARKVWNQHPYNITNINDDLSVPVTAVQNFTKYNSFHSALPLASGASLGDELDAEILSVCEDDCDHGSILVIAHGRNTGNGEVPAGISFALYGRKDDVDTLLATAITTLPTPAEMTTEAVSFTPDSEAVVALDALWVVVDDDGTGTSHLAECVEENNGAIAHGPFCK